MILGGIRPLIIEGIENLGGIIEKRVDDGGILKKCSIIGEFVRR